MLVFTAQHPALIRSSAQAFHPIRSLIWTQWADNGHIVFNCTTQLPQHNCADQVEVQTHNNYYTRPNAQACHRHGVNDKPVSLSLSLFLSTNTPSSQLVQSVLMMMVL